MAPAVPELVQDLLAFLDAAPTPFHAVSEVKRRLEAAGYARKDEGEAWALAPGDRFYVTRGDATIAAFEIGHESPMASGFRLVGAHTDSPNLRIKPNPDLTAAGCAQLAVEPYGGVLYHTWLDRDLGLAGRVFVRTKNGVEMRLVDARRPLLRIPSLAIHLQRGVNTDGLVLNAQKHLPPLYALATSEVRDLRSLLAAELGSALAPADLAGWDLMTTDTQPSVVLGASNEFVCGPRLDNLASCHAATVALTTAGPASGPTRGIVLYDHEEVGSKSAHGAASSFLGETLRRILHARGESEPDALPRAIARSFFISADMAHAGHPNHADRHDPQHMPLLGQGPVLKVNTNQSYATDGESWARFEHLAAQAEVPTQRFVTRSDLGCGSTIGPMTAAALGIRTVDVGNPMLSMHSCREMAASADVPRMIAVLRASFAS